MNSNKQPMTHFIVFIQPTLRESFILCLNYNDITYGERNNTVGQRMSKVTKRYIFYIVVAISDGFSLVMCKRLDGETFSNRTIAALLTCNSQSRHSVLIQHSISVNIQKALRVCQLAQILKQFEEMHFLRKHFNIRGHFYSC